MGIAFGKNLTVSGKSTKFGIGIVLHKLINLSYGPIPNLAREGTF